MIVKAIWFVPDARCEQDMLEADIEYGLDGRYGDAVVVVEESSWIEEFKKILRDDYGITVVAEESWIHNQ